MSPETGATSYDGDARDQARPRATGTAARGSLPWGLLAWLYCVVLWLTWTPTRDAPPEILWLPPRMSWPVILGNFLLFAPIGAVVAAWRAFGSRGVGKRGSRDVLWVAGVVMVLSCIVELGQLRIPGRHLSPYDVAMNSVGAGIAAWLTLRLLRTGIRPRAVFAGAGTPVFIGIMIYLTATGFAGSRMTALFQWDEEYGVLAGDEFGGGREYRGIVSGAEICGGEPDDEICVGPGDGPEARDDLTAAVRDAQRTRIAAEVTSRGPQIDGARIVTFSADIGHRNATLYQRGEDLAFRLRTPRSGPNATELVYLLPDAVRAGLPTYVVAEFQPGRVIVAASDSQRSIRHSFPLGYLSGWWLVKEPRQVLIEARTLIWAALVAAAAFATPLGLLAGSVARVPVVARLLAGGALPLFVLMPVAGALRMSTTTEDVVLCMGFGLVGAGLGILDSGITPLRLAARERPGCRIRRISRRRLRPGRRTS